jgi:hypothetical protein
MPLTLTRPDLIRSANYIAGEWLATAGPLLDVTDPATGYLITRVPDSGAAEARAALDAAHAAFPAWRKVPAKQRAQIIKRWNDLVLAHQDDLGTLISLEQGKPLAEGKGEVAYAASYIEWFGEEATRMNGETIPAPVPGRHHAVELPGRDDRAQDRPGAGGRLHRGLQAGRRHTVDIAGAGAAGTGGGRAARCAQHRHRLA